MPQLTILVSQNRPGSSGLFEASAVEVARVTVFLFAWTE